jgi:hypothetical protein
LEYQSRAYNAQIMATPKYLDALAQVHASVEEIQRHIRPLLRLLNDPQTNRHDRAMAQAGIALSLGTVRYMCFQKRLAFKKQWTGTTTTSSTSAAATTDPQTLRKELDHIRKLLVQLQKKNKGQQKQQQKTGAEKFNHTSSSPTKLGSGSKRKGTEPSSNNEKKRCHGV